MLKSRKRQGMFARCLLLCIMTMFCVGTVGAGVFLIGATAGVGALAAPFVFAIPENLKSTLTEAEIKGLEDLGAQVGKYLDQEKKGLLTQEELNAGVKSLWDSHVKEWGITKESFIALQTTLKEQGLEIRTLVENSNGGGKEKPETFSKQISNWVKSDNFKSSVQNKTSTSTELKAATPLSAYVTSAGAVDGLIPAFSQAPELFRIDVDRTIHTSPSEPNILWRMFYKGSSNAAMVIWFNRVNEQGGARFLPEYGLKPLMSWEYRRETAQPYKIAVKVKISMEMLDDASFIEGEIRTVLNEDLEDKIDKALLFGTGVNEPEGIATWASAYGGTNLDGRIANVNDADALRACVLQLRNLNFVPNVVVVSPTTKAVLDLTKNSTGNYLKPEIDALLRGLNIIENTRIPEGDFLMADTRKFNVKGKGGLRMSTGWGVNQMAQGAEIPYASDFEINAVTILLEQQFFAYHNSIDEVSAIYDNFDTVKTALSV